jgi:DNA-directed RNA polymerase specialized sigma24 family protein
MALRDDRSTPRESWRDLVPRIRAGDEAAFEAMFRAYYDPLCRHVAPYLGSRDAAEDSKALIVLNTTAQERTFAVRWSGQFFRYVLPAGAVVTFFWS